MARRPGRADVHDRRGHGDRLGVELVDAIDQLCEGCGRGVDLVVVAAEREDLRLVKESRIPGAADQLDRAALGLGGEG